MPLSTNQEAVFGWASKAIMDYGCLIWGNCSRDLLVKIHKIVKMYARSIRDIQGKRRSSSVKYPDVVNASRCAYTLLYWHPNVQYCSGIAPPYLNEMFKTNSQLHTCIQCHK